MESINRIAETSDWLAVNKPAGLITERSPFEKPTVEDLVWSYLLTQKKKPFLGVVHRLDRVTSGVLLFAKKKSVLKELNAHFANRSVEKVYLAMTEKAPPAEEGTLVHHLYKDQKNKQALLFDKARKDTQRVELHWKLQQQTDRGYIIEVYPLTGKFHQIRAQLAHIGCPILGDVKYGSNQPWANNAIALHAWQLRIAGLDLLAPYNW